MRFSMHWWVTMVCVQTLGLLVVQSEQGEVLAGSHGKKV